MTVLLTDYDSTTAVRGEWFICANTGEFVMRTETCSSRFDFTVRAVTLSGSHISHTHTRWLCLCLLIIIKIWMEIQNTQQSCGLCREFQEKSQDMTFQSTEIIITIYRGHKELCFRCSLKKRTQLDVQLFSHLLIQKKLLITFDYLFYHICYHSNINCNITVPWHW